MTKTCHSLKRWLLLALLLAVAGCDGGHGPDSLFTRPTYTPVSVPECVRCHHVPVGSRRQIMGPGGDFGQNPAIASHHVVGANDPSPTQCLVCHELDQHGSGTVRLKNADTGAVIPATSRANVETFCLSCHDTNGANNDMSPLADGRALGSIYPADLATRYPTANEIATIGWTAPDNAHADDGLYATASPGQNAVIESRWGNFGFDGVLPARIERGKVNTVQIIVQYRVDTQASIAQLNAQATVGGIDCPTSPRFHATEPLADRIVTFDVTSCRTWTVNDLLDATFKVKLGASRGDSATPVTFSLDYVQVQASYNGTSYVMSTQIRDDWNKNFGHRQKGLSCLGNGGPGTGCHGNAHGTGNVSLMAKNMTLPLPGRYRESDYALCLDCHQSYPLVAKEIIFGITFSGNYDGNYGPLQDPPLRAAPFNTHPPYDLSLSGGIRTRFSDKNAQGSGKPYDNTNMFGQYLNLHWMHNALQGWDYRGSGVTSGFSCTACHGVHGSATQWGMIYDDLQYSQTAVGPDIYGRMYGNAAAFSGPPSYCSFNCHEVIENFVGPSHSWFEPPNE